jgi:hypothetical protein
MHVNSDLSGLFAGKYSRHIMFVQRDLSRMEMTALTYRAFCSFLFVRIDYSKLCLRVRWTT